MSFNIPVDADHIVLICGQTDSGKSTLFRYLMYQFKLAKVNFLIYDIGGEHSRTSLAKGLTEGQEIYVPRGVSVEEFEEVCERVWSTGNMFFGVEEIDLFCTPWTIPEIFKTMCIRHRHRGIGIGLSTRRIADVHKLPCSQARHVFIFQLFLPQQVYYLKQFVGDVAEQARTLPPYYFIYYHSGKAQIYKPIPQIN